MNCDLKKSNHGYHKDQLERFSIPNYQLDDLLEVPAAETHSQAEVVQTLAAAVEAITGTHPRVEGSGPACDGWMFITGGFLFRSRLFRDTMHKGLHLCIRGGFLRSLIEVMAHKQGYSRRPGR
jgi:acetylornithine deacetylase/succinyl-diaminopimelate desuccinylase-like protein